MTKPNIALRCFYGCKIDSFSRRQALIRHLQRQHDLVLSTDRKAGQKEGNIQQHTASSSQNAITTLFACPCCSEYFATIDELRVHAYGFHRQSSKEGPSQDKPSDQYVELDSDTHSTRTTFKDMASSRSKENTPSEDPPNEYTDQMAIISPSIVIPDLPQHEHPVHDIRRSYDDAVLYACQQLGDTEDNQRKTLFITDTLKLKPFAIINADGIEQNGLAHANVIEKAVRSASTIQSTIPSKRSLHAMETTQADLCFSCYPPPPGDLGSLFAISPYGKLLRQRKYTMLSNELCDLANHDWRFHPQTKYYVAQLFAGAILFRTDNHQAIIINTVEAYGRGKSVDIHREIFGMKKGTAIETSLPPAFNIRYPDVWPTTLSTSDGKKLLIGTQSCNLLVTSSLRLDKVDDPCVGATTVNFDLQNKTNSLACAIYLDVESVTKSLALANEPATKSINKYGYLYQMRQLNSKYDDGTSYFLVRCSSHFARNHAAQPFTLFTLADFNNVRNPAASLFNAIACNVLESGNTAVVNKGLILELQARSTGKVKEVLDTIAKMFEKDTCIPILKNAQLNKSLEKLAILLHPSLANANKSVQKAIHQQFTSHP